MSIETETPSVSADTDNLDDFHLLLHGQAQEPEVTEEPASPEEEVEPQENTEEDTPQEEVVDEEAPEEKPKRNKTQERITDLNSKYREQERRANELEAIVNELRGKVVQEKPTEVKGPTPEDKAEDGTDKYPLGEFDPNYISDTVKHTLKVEREAQRIEDAKLAEETRINNQKQEIQGNWISKLAPAQERYSDFNDVAAELLDSLADIEPAYGQYLEQTIMAMDHGPDVLYYLATHPDEAQRIVNSGATKATISLGRIESRFIDDKPESRTKPSKAPSPPPTNKGQSATISVSPDTDNLDDFANLLFPKKR